MFVVFRRTTWLHAIEKQMPFQIDILVNNSGRSQRSMAEDTELAVHQEMMDVNYTGVISLTKAVLPHFMERKQGHIVVTSSVAGKLGW